jgi:hypothetical protein
LKSVILEGDSTSLIFTESISDFALEFSPGRPVSNDYSVLFPKAAFKVMTLSQAKGFVWDSTSNMG